MNDLVTRLDAEERASVEAALGPPFYLTADKVTKGAGGMFTVQIDVEARQLAPIVPPDQPTPDAPEALRRRLEATGPSREDAIDDLVGTLSKGRDPGSEG